MSEIPRFSDEETRLMPSDTGYYVLFADHLKELEGLRAERDEFERKGKELCCAYGNSLITIHDLRADMEKVEALLSNANEERRVLRALLRSKDEQLAGMRAEITVAQLKRAGCQGLAAVSACPAINRILHERAWLAGPSPAQEEKP